MKIKHFAGYGCVNARKVNDKTYCDQYVRFSDGKIYYSPRVVSIEVTGEHEWGLNRSEYYSDCYNWLLKRFAKDAEEDDIMYIDFNYLSDDNAIYKFYLKTDKTVW